MAPQQLATALPGQPKGRGGANIAMLQLIIQSCGIRASVERPVWSQAFLDSGISW